MISALVNGAALCLYAILMKPFFLSNDDAAMRFMVDGTRYAADSHLVYQNVILGWIYRLLYAVTRRFPWYTIVQWALIFCALTAIGYVFLTICPLWAGLAAAMLTTGLAGYECYVRIQYTRTCAVLAAAAMLLLYTAAMREKLVWQEAAAGLLLGFFGSLYRLPMFLSSAMLTTGGALFVFLVQFGEGKFMLRSEGAGAGGPAGNVSEGPAGDATEGPLKDRAEKQAWHASEKPAGNADAGRRRTFVRLFSLCAAMIVLAIAPAGVDKLAYRSSTWKEYTAFNDARTQLLDYGFPSYKKNKEKYEALGIDTTAFDLLVHWNFADPQVFTTEVFEEIGSWKEEKPSLAETAGEFIRKVPGGLTKRRGLFYALAALLLCIALSASSRKGRWALLLAALYECVLFTVLYFYLFRQGRYLVEWVDSGMLFGTGMTLWFLALASLRLNKKGTAVSAVYTLIPAVLCVLVMVIFRWDTFSPMLRSGEDAKNMQYAKIMRQNRLMEAAGDKEHLYLLMLGTLSDDDSFGPFDMAVEKSMDNLLWMGGWAAWTDIYLQTAAAWNVENPYRDMIDREDILLVDSEIEKTLSYLRSHYDPSVKAEKAGNLGDFPVYHIVSDGQN